MKTILLAVLTSVAAPAVAASPETALFDAAQSLELAGPAAKAVLADGGDAALRHRIYALTDKAYDLEKKMDEIKTGLLSVGVLVDSFAKRPGGDKELYEVIKAVDAKVEALFAPIQELADGADKAQSQTSDAAKVGTAAQAFRDAARRLRARCAGMGDASKTLLDNTWAQQGPLGPEPHREAQKIDAWLAQVEFKLDGLIEKSEGLLRKSK